MGDLRHGSVVRWVSGFTGVIVISVGHELTVHVSVVQFNSERMCTSCKMYFPAILQTILLINSVAVCLSVCVCVLTRVAQVVTTKHRDL